MSVVTLVSGGLDSTLMAVLAKEAGVATYPLFIDYGQISRDRELAACRSTFKALKLPEPEIAHVSGIGELIPSGLTDPKMDIFKEAFLPGRNIFFLLLGASYAFKMRAGAVSIGLLDEKTSIFPDQTKSFTFEAERFLSKSIGRDISILTPLIFFSKQDVISLAEKKGITGTYSCHSGLEMPCGICIACREFNITEE